MMFWVVAIGLFVSFGCLVFALALRTVSRRIFLLEKEIKCLQLQAANQSIVSCMMTTSPPQTLQCIAFRNMENAHSLQNANSTVEKDVFSLPKNQVN